MADRPLSGPLPADLPEDWTSGQTIAPAGADVGLSEQHGYNYLMAAVNRAQQAVNAINEGFDAISVKQANRVVVGTSTAGWTEDDCDFLCDGTDDHVEIQAAIEASKEGDEIYFLSGTYMIDAPLEAKQNLIGSGTKETMLNFGQNCYSSDTCVSLTMSGTIENMTIACTTIDNSSEKDYYMIGFKGDSNHVSKVRLWPPSDGGSITCLEQVNYLSITKCRLCSVANKPDINANCFLVFCENYLEVGTSIQCYCYSGCVISGNSGYNPTFYISGTIDYGAISNNHLSSIEIDGMSGNTIISGNTFMSNRESITYIYLGEETKNFFVAGNSFLKPYNGRGTYTITDNGTNNIIRFNSNDTGGGSGIAGVTSFKGRSGAVLPQSGDYTAAMVGAIPTGTVAAIQELTQAEYDALATKDPSTLYLIEG